MRFAYIDSQGKEVTIPSIDALRLRIELKAIVEDTMFHDANSGKWAPAREHEIFRTLQRELQELDAGGFAPPPEPGDAGAAPAGEPADVDGTPDESLTAQDMEPPAADATAPDATAPPESGIDADEDPGSGPEAEDADDDDFGLGMTLDLVPEDDTEPEVAELDESAAAGIGGAALEGLEGLELAGDWDDGGEAEDVGADDRPAPGTGPAPEVPTGDAAAARPPEPGATDGPAGLGDEEAAATPERFAMSPQDDLMGSVPDPGLAGEDEDDGEAGADQGFGGDLELEPGLAESFEADALSAGTAASDELELESPLSNYDADQPPTWMQTGDDEPGGPESLAPATDGGLAQLDDGEPPPLDSREVPPPVDRGEPPARPTPRPRNAPPQRKLRKASTPGIGRLVLLLLAVGVVAVGGWYGFQAFAGGGGAAGAEDQVALPEIPADLLPQMRQYAASAVSEMVASVAALPEREAIPSQPDQDWLAGNYLAGASNFESVPTYWSAVLDYVDAAEAVAPDAFLAGLDGEIADANLTADNAALIRERAVAGWDAAAVDRQLVFDQLRAVANAAVDLHDFVVENEGQITYEPASGGISRDPVLEAVPASEALGDAMWARVGDITRTLDNLGYLETVTTDGLLQTFLDKLGATPIR